jgi:transposase
MMPGRRKKTVDIRELVLHLRKNPSDRAVADKSKMHRQTVKRYRAWAAAQGLLGDEPLPSLGELEKLVQATLPEKPPPQNISSVEPFRETVKNLRRTKTEMTAIHERLTERGFTGSYSAVRRFVHTLEPKQPKEVFVRVECEPGQQAQVDFGYAGKMLDPATGKLRKTWAFVMTLSYSRHQYVEFVFDQTVATWLLCHRHAFEFFGGVVEEVVLDNLKAAIIRACFDDPLVQQSYRECAEHYGYLIAPCRPATPQHKGKVEQGGVHYVKRNFLGGRQPTSVTQANQDVRRWCNTTAGQRIHGTTKEQPLVRFQEVERARLKPLPEAPYDLAVWAEVIVPSDGHIVFDNGYYSVPLDQEEGTQLLVRGGAQQVDIYDVHHQWVATHDRATKPGQRMTHPDHLPPEKVQGLLLDRQNCRAAAEDIGPATGQIVAELLDDKVINRLRTAGRLLKLREKYGDQRLEAACTKALQYDEPVYATVKRILSGGLEAEKPADEPATTRPAHIFVRTASELLGHLFGGAAWN